VSDRRRQPRTREVLINADETLLHVTDLTKTFASRQRSLGTLMGKTAPGVVALDGISLDVHKHQIVGVVGESGSGKSTLAKCLVRLVEPDSGSVVFRSQDVLKLRGRELAAARRAMQMIYQDPYSSLNPMMTVGKAIREAAQLEGRPTRAEEDANLHDLLARVSLSQKLADSRPRELSGGQRQRVAIARAMAVQPELLLADEAVSALDVSVQAQILNLFARLRDDVGVAIVFITHDLSVVAYVADVVMVMYLGAVMETGPTDQIFAAPGHPYTAALLSAQPGRHRRQRVERPVLSGEIPSAMNIPSGCRFRTRCPLAQDVCAEIAPPPVDVGEGQTAWCHFATEVASGQVLAPNVG
jgi:oligopeptide transport system ATP-binding protein